MIFVDINGSIGDQLFQFATARSLSMDRDSDFLIIQNSSDDSIGSDNLNNSDNCFDKVNDSTFKLDKFNFDFKFITEDELNSNYTNVHKAIEPSFTDTFLYQINLQRLPTNIYLIGSWQNPNYFKHHVNTIKRDLDFDLDDNIIDDEIKQLANEIRNSNSVCISYNLENSIDSYYVSQYGVCTREYYENAMKFISQKIDNPHFFVFTSDRESFEIDDYPITYVDTSDREKDFEYLYLMTLCKDFIIENSSTSWWGAWLSKNENKSVFAPTPWYNSYTNQLILPYYWYHLKNDRSDLFNNSNNIIFNLVNEEDMKKLNLTNFTANIERFGISIRSLDEQSKIEFSNVYSNDSKSDFIFELKLFAQKPGLIKVEDGENETVVLGYLKGYSNRYLHLRDVDLDDLCLEIEDESLIVENIAIKLLD